MVNMIINTYMLDGDMLHKEEGGPNTFALKKYYFQELH